MAAICYSHRILAVLINEALLEGIVIPKTEGLVLYIGTDGRTDVYA